MTTAQRRELITQLEQLTSDNLRNFITHNYQGRHEPPTGQSAYDAVHSLVTWAESPAGPGMSQIQSDLARHIATFGNPGQNPPDDQADDIDNLADADGLERSRNGRHQPNRNRQVSDFDSCTGYDPDFLGPQALVPLPVLPGPLAVQAFVVDENANGLARFVLPYTHFSVVMNAQRRMAFYSAVNIDGLDAVDKNHKIDRADWYFDPRIPAQAQAGDEVYRGSKYQRGHLTRRQDAVWGSHATAKRGSDDTFCFTNACPQVGDLNQKEWLELEDYVLKSAKTYRLRVCVITGPVFHDSDHNHRQIRVPKEFWKVVVILRSDTMKLSATGYLLSQADMIGGLEFHYEGFKTYQLSLAEIARKTGLDFGTLPDSDPLNPARQRGGLESTQLPEKIEIHGPADIIY